MSVNHVPTAARPLCADNGAPAPPPGALLSVAGCDPVCHFSEPSHKETP